MISKPIEDITKACETAEESAATRKIDYAVLYCKDIPMNPGDYRGMYAVQAVVDLDDTLEFKYWQLIAIAKPIGLVYTWSRVPGYETSKELEGNDEHELKYDDGHRGDKQR